MPEPFAPPFLASEPRATALLPDSFRRVEAWREEAAARRSRRIAPELYAALAEQQAGLPESAARRENLAALQEPGTIVAVSGQQVGLFLGPLYTFYKAATAIAWARALEAQTGARCVPLFWLQTEDHDFAEIASCTLATKDGALSLSLPLQDARCSVAYCPLPPEVEGLTAQLEAALAGLPFAEEVAALWRAAYQPGRTLPAAFAQLIAALFADEGLLVLDPRCAAVAQLSAPIYQAALARSSELDACLLARGQELEAAGLREQVHVRRGSPLVFFHPQGFDGPRYRLTAEGDGLRLDGGGLVTREALVDLARREPLRFSTSALLRPIVQDSLLPTAVYLGGPAELGYLAQCAPLYRLLGVRPAMAAPRARFRLLEPRISALLAELQLTPAEVEAPRAQLLSRLAAGRAGEKPEGDLARELLGDLGVRIEALAAARPALGRAALRTRNSVTRALSRFVGRRARLLSEEDRTLAGRIDRLQATLFPGAVPQERVFALPSFAARFGLAALKAAVLAAVEPGRSGVKDLAP